MKPRVLFQPIDGLTITARQVLQVPVLESAQAHGYKKTSRVLRNQGSCSEVEHCTCLVEILEDRMTSPAH